LAFYADLLLDADVLALVLECAVRFVVRGGACTAKGYRETVAYAEAGERLLLSMLRFECSDLEDEGGIEDEEVEGYGRW
jgi:hypothetical protein